ncbi:MAG: glycine zipper 2TM domain-containing protein [Rhodoferax sp.]|nr:glycine zipper 2TM domain-containing protein [Rhodoferax sp.]
MPIARLFHRIHPLVAVAAVTVTLFSLLGIAAITGVLPSSRGNSATAVSTAPPPTQAVADDWDANKPLPKTAQAKHVTHTQTAVAHDAGVQAQHNPAPSAPVQTAHKPAPQNSPVGIGVGAVIGGVLGNQMGSGDGKTLATIAGALGGGYIGNEVAKKNQQP